MIRRNPLGEDGHFLAEKREEIKRSLPCEPQDPRRDQESWRDVEIYPYRSETEVRGNLQDRTGGVQEVDKDLQCTEGGLASGAGGDNTSETDSPEAYGCQNTKATDATLKDVTPKEATPAPEEQDECS